MINKEIRKILKNENQVFFLKKQSEPGFLDSFILGFMVYLIKGNDYDYLIITNRRIVTIRRNKVLTNVEYKTDKKLIFNSIKSEITGLDLENNNITIGLSFIRLTYEEIQNIKKILNA